MRLKLSGLKKKELKGASKLLNAMQTKGFPTKKLPECLLIGTIALNALIGLLLMTFISTRTELMDYMFIAKNDVPLNSTMLDKVNIMFLRRVC